MDEKFREFWDAAQEIDSLNLEGYFGEEARYLTVKRDSMDLSDFIVECIDGWIKDTNQYGKESVKGLILVFLKLYTEAIQAGGQIAIDVLSGFFIGFPENPETECLSSFTEFVRSNVETRSLTQQLKNKRHISIGDKKRLGNSILETYRKGVELIGKILTSCILLKQIANGETIEPMKIYTKSIGKKTEQFLDLSKGKYDILIDAIDRDIRNAEAHLDIRFHPGRVTFHLKVKQGNKIKTKEISADQMMVMIFPKVRWIVQAFTYSSMLLVLCGTGPTKFKKVINQLYHLEFTSKSVDVHSF